MRVREVLSGRPVIWIQADDDLTSAGRTLLSSRCAALPVISTDGRLVGVLGEREILAARLASSSDGPAPDCAAAAMVADPPVVQPDDPLSEAARLMLDRGVPAVPVVLRNGSVIGIVTMPDIVAYFVHTAASGNGHARLRVGDVMCMRPASVRAHERLLDAVTLMVELRIRHLPVVTDEGVVVGMISDRDIRTAIGDPLRALAADGSGARVDGKRVADYMTPRVVTVTPEAPIEDATARLMARRVGALPVVDANRRLVGVISYVDVMRAVTTLNAGYRQPSEHAAAGG